ncbi:MAG: hypothetical protein DRO67_00035 [Candidatus Asgardarchaeum californiense]|nr:MAG: hypothetical protein DRO67_00035 [Candidatus Asgardarchaeum californiense]
MKEITYHVTCHPIDRDFLERVGIYDNSRVHYMSLGTVLAAVVDAGYTKIHSHYAQYNDGERRINIHCKKIYKEV